MKLILAIVHDEDARKVVDELNENDYSVTKLCSTGGFLKAGNTTLIIGVEADKVDFVIEIIEKKSKSRKHGIQVPANPEGFGTILYPNSLEVVIGGATIFVMDVERFEKV